MKDEAAAILAAVTRVREAQSRAAQCARDYSQARQTYQIANQLQRDAEDALDNLLDKITVTPVTQRLIIDISERRSRESQHRGT